MKTQEEHVHTARESGHRSDEATDLGIENRMLDQEAIARLAYFYWEERDCPMTHLTRTGSGQKQNFATGSLPPHHIHDCRRCAMSQSTVPAYITSLIRHFADLRNGTHGGSAG